MKRTITQCKSCPWRVDCVPDRDIPNGYSESLHRRLSCTIASGSTLTAGGLKAMACHYSPVYLIELVAVLALSRPEWRV